MTFGTWRWWGCQPHAPAAFTPRSCSWYSFSLGAESTPGPWNVQKEYTTEKSSDTTGNRSRDRPTSSAASFIYYMLSYWQEKQQFLGSSIWWYGVIFLKPETSLGMFGVGLYCFILHEFSALIFISGIATTRLALQELMQYSLLSVQALRLGVDLHREIDRMLAKLIKQQALNTRDSKQSRWNLCIKISLPRDKYSHTHTHTHLFFLYFKWGQVMYSISVCVHFVFNDFDMIYLLTAIGLPPGGSSMVHIYTQTVHRTTHNKQYIEQHKHFRRVQAVLCLVECPVLSSCPILSSCPHLVERAKWRLCRITSRNPSRQLAILPDTEIKRGVQSIPLLLITCCYFNFSAVTFRIYLDCPLSWHSFYAARLLHVPILTVPFLPIGLLHVFMFIMTSGNIIFLFVRKAL